MRNPEAGIALRTYLDEYDGLVKEREDQLSDLRQHLDASRTKLDQGYAAKRGRLEDEYEYDKSGVERSFGEKIKELGRKQIMKWDLKVPDAVDASSKHMQTAGGRSSKDGLGVHSSRIGDMQHDPLQRWQPSTPALTGISPMQSSNPISTRTTVLPSATARSPTLPLSQGYGSSSLGPSGVESSHGPGEPPVYYSFIDPRLTRFDAYLEQPPRERLHTPLFDDVEYDNFCSSVGCTAERTSKVAFCSAHAVEAKQSRRAMDSP